MRFHVEAVTGAEKDFGIGSPSDGFGYLMASNFFQLLPCSQPRTTPRKTP